MRSVVYYFTGTGNSLWLARKIKEKLEDCDIKPIIGMINNVNITIEEETVGIVFPMYYYGLPVIVRRFVQKADFSRVKYIYAAVTHGGPYFMEGGAVSQLEDMLKRKGVKLNTALMFWMSTNYIPDFKPLPSFFLRILFFFAGRKAGKIAKIIQQGRKLLERGNTKLDNSPEYPKFIDRCFSSDKNYWVQDQCNSCAICEKICPVGNIELIDGKPRWKHQCQLCMACIQYCPKEAIQYAGKTDGKKRYRNPYIHAADIIKQKE